MDEEPRQTTCPTRYKCRVQHGPAADDQHTHSYQFSLLTSRQPEQVLHEFASKRLPGIEVAERGASYLILRPVSRRRYGPELALIAAAVIVLVVLMLTAITPWLVALLPLAVVPAIPMLLDHRPDLAVSAVPEDEPGSTRVTVHGMAAPQLSAALDAYLGGLPRYIPIAEKAPEPAAVRTAVG